MSQKKIDSTFLTKPVKYDSGVVRGFIVYPHNEDGSGWGTPYKDEAGNLIVPGTPDGALPDAVLGVKDGKWKSYRSEKLQSAGNIDWKGPWVTGEKDKRRIVTVNGPSQRYWNTGAFDYDASDRNHHIYHNGNVCAIAPKPVLGACIKLQTTTTDSLNGPVTTTDWWVVAICKTGFSDEVFVRKGLSVLQEDSITEETREKEVRLQSQISSYETDVNGWISLGVFSGLEDGIPSVPPEAPWFFNETGLQARTMRRCVFQHSDQASGEPMDDTVFRELSVDVNIPSKLASFYNVDVEARCKVTNKFRTNLHVEKRKVEYIQPALESLDGDTHRFDSTGVYAYYQLYGSAKVCVDWHPTVQRWVYGWLKCSFFRMYANDWSVCTDDGITWGSVDNRVGSTTGPQPGIEIDTWLDNYPQPWIGHGDGVTFNINQSNANSTPTIAEIQVGWTQTGSESVAAGLPPDPTDTILYFIDSYDTWFKYVDIRHSLIVGETLYNFVDYSTGAYGIVTEEEIIGSVLGGPPNPGTERWEVYDSVMYDAPDSHLFQRTMTKPPSNKGSLFPPNSGWTSTDRDTWPEAEEGTQSENFVAELEGVNYSFKVTNENSDESTAAPFWKDGIPTWMTTATRPNWFKLTVPEMLTTPGRCDAVGIFGVTELEEQLVYLEYYDKTESRNVAKAFSGTSVDGDPIEALKGGTKMYPGGLL